MALALHSTMYSTVLYKGTVMSIQYSTVLCARDLYHAFTVHYYILYSTASKAQTLYFIQYSVLYIYCTQYISVQYSAFYQYCTVRAEHCGTVYCRYYVSQSSGFLLSHNALAEYQRLQRKPSLLIMDDWQRRFTFLQRNLTSQFCFIRCVLSLTK